MNFLWLAKLCIVFMVSASAPTTSMNTFSAQAQTISSTAGETLAQNKTSKRKRIARRARRPNKETNIAGFLSFILPILMFVATLFVAYLHRRSRFEGAAAVSSAPAKKRQVHFAKPRNLKHEGGPDPATMTDDALQTGDIIPLSGINSVKQQTNGSNTQAHVVLGQSLVEHELTSAGLTIKDADLASAAPARVDTSLRLPGEMASSFTGLAGERLLDQASFAAWGESTGILAVTNLRLLVVYRQTMATVLPPFIATQEKRHKLSLSQIDEVRPGSAHRVPILWPGLAICWWYPIGTLLSLAGIVVYYALPRTVMEIVSGPVIRKYPILDGQLENIMQTIGRKSAERRAQKRSRRRKQAS